MLRLQANHLAATNMPPGTETQDFLRSVVAAPLRNQQVHLLISDRAHSCVAHAASVTCFVQKREKLSQDAQATDARTQHSRRAAMITAALFSHNVCRPRAKQLLPA
jgi:hypothetical protein